MFRFRLAWIVVFTSLLVSSCDEDELLGSVGEDVLAEVRIENGHYSTDNVVWFVNHQDGRLISAMEADTGGDTLIFFKPSDLSENIFTLSEYQYFETVDRHIINTYAGVSPRVFKRLNLFHEFEYRGIATITLTGTVSADQGIVSWPYVGLTSSTLSSPYQIDVYGPSGSGFFVRCKNQQKDSYIFETNVLPGEERNVDLESLNEVAGVYGISYPPGNYDSISTEVEQFSLKGNFYSHRYKVEDTVFTQPSGSDLNLSLPEELFTQPSWLTKIRLHQGTTTWESCTYANGVPVAVTREDGSLAVTSAGYQGFGYSSDGSFSLLRISFTYQQGNADLEWNIFLDGDASTVPQYVLPALITDNRIDPDPGQIQFEYLKGTNFSSPIRFDQWIELIFDQAGISLLDEGYEERSKIITEN